jgi:hypothetical protein
MTQKIGYLSDSLHLPGKGEKYEFRRTANLLFADFRKAHDLGDKY